MARDPQNPVDEELERAERDGEPQQQTTNEALDGDLEQFAESLEHEADDIEGQANPEAEVLAARVEELEQALAEAKDQSMRAAAEAQNARRRAEQDADKAKKFALEKFVKELLPVVDSLEKALESMGDVDVIGLVRDATDSIGAGDRFVLRSLEAARAPVILVLNKMDLTHARPDEVATEIEDAVDDCLVLRTVEAGRSAGF